LIQSIAEDEIMQMIRCTKKLQQEMGLKESDLEVAGPAFSYLGGWHANLIHIDRRKCVLFVNDRTLFNFIAPDVSREQIRELSVLFKSYLRCVLAEEGIAESVKQRIFSEYAEIAYGNTNNKSVLGSMNDLAFHYKYQIMEEGGVHGCMVPSIISRLNHMPMGAIRYVYPIKALMAMYETAI
jgi:hypothetical protein